MAKLRDVRRRFPPEDPDAYTAAYADATLAGELGELLHDLRVEAGLSEGELAARTGVDEDEVVRAEEGGSPVSVAYLDRVARALGRPMAVVAGDAEIPLGADAPVARGETPDGERTPSGG